MTKQKTEILDPLTIDSIFYLKLETKGSYKDNWIIYSKTKWGDKIFSVYYTKEQALLAIKYYELNFVEN